MKDEEWAKHYIYAKEKIGAFFQLVKHDVHPDSVGQFTGEFDINGVKVFEGDIDSLGRVVEFSYGSFILTDKNGQYALLGDCDFIEIAGNTFKTE